MPRVYCCQHDIQWEDAPRNCQRVRHLLAGIVPASLVLLPEMFATGFTMTVGNADRAASIRNFLAATAADLGIFIQAGVTLPGPDGKGHNASLTFDPSGACVCQYVKLHPFAYGTESKYYAPGESLAAFPWQGFVAAPLICYDLRFPEVFRTAALRGATLLTVIANWPIEREAHWLALLSARAIENQAYVAAVNRVGTDPKLTYGGRSLIIDPRGVVIADAGNAEKLISAELDLSPLQSYRAEFPALADMRVEYCDAFGRLL